MGLLCLLYVLRVRISLLQAHTGGNPCIGRGIVERELKVLRVISGLALAHIGELNDEAFPWDRGYVCRCIGLGWGQSECEPHLRLLSWPKREAGVCIS
jgi:hypothetical protein